MNPKVFWLITAILLISISEAEAQQAAKIFRIGFLSSLSPESVTDRTDAFREGLRERGYVEGKNLVIEWRYAHGKIQRLPILAADLVQSKVAVIVTGGPAVNRFAKEATQKIPIVLAFDNDPVGNGFASSLAHPGGNITGFSTHYPEISGKQLEILKEMIPRITRVAVLGNSTLPGNKQALREAEAAAQALGIKLQYLEIQTPQEIDSAFRGAKTGQAEAAVVLGSQVVTSHQKQFAQLAAKNYLPAIYWSPEFVDSGGLMAYSVSIADLFRRTANYVDKILKGASPADLPIEQPTKFELVINLKTAKQIGLTIPPNVLARADRVIR
jgi:putative ABC transport system substrate-binding protein